MGTVCNEPSRDFLHSASLSYSAMSYSLSVFLLLVFLITYECFTVGSVVGELSGQPSTMLRKDQLVSVLVVQIQISLPGRTLCLLYMSRYTHCFCLIVRTALHSCKGKMFLSPFSP